MPACHDFHQMCLRDNLADHADLRGLVRDLSDNMVRRAVLSMKKSGARVEWQRKVKL